MGDQVDGKVERGNAGGVRAEREAADDAPASRGKFLPVERKIFAVNARTLFSGDIEGEEMARSTSIRAPPLIGLPASWARVRENSSLRSAMAAEMRRRTRWRSEGGKAARGAKGLDRRGDGGFGVFAASLHDSGDQGAVIGGANLDDVAVFPPLAVYEETVGRNRRDRHLCHDFFWPPIKTTSMIIGLFDRDH